LHDATLSLAIFEKSMALAGHHLDESIDREYAQGTAGKDPESLEH